MVSTPAAAAPDAPDGSTEQDASVTEYVEQQKEKLRKVLSDAGSDAIDDWQIDARMRQSGKTSGQLDSYYVSPQGKRFRSLREVQEALKPAKAGAVKPRAAAAANGHKTGRANGSAPAAGEGEERRERHKRKRNVTNYAYLDTMHEQVAVLKAAEANKARRARQAAGRKGKKSLRSSGSGAAAGGALSAGDAGDEPARRPGVKGEESLLAFDPKRHPFRSTLSRAKAHVSRLLQEQHTLQIFAVDASKSRKVVKQTHEMKRAKDQIAKSQQIIRECLKQCEEALGHKAIADECFDENGEVDFQHILCSACDEPDADDDNDILLCDGEFCNRAYHVGCCPFLRSFQVDDVPEGEGWLCPACDCRYDILWELSQAFEDLDFDELIKTHWGDILVGDELMKDLEAATGPPTILTADLPSDDEDDEDFEDDEDDEEGGGDAAPDANGASTSAAARAAQVDAADDDEEDDEEEAGGADGGEKGDEEPSDDGDDDDYYSDDTDDDGNGTDMATLLAALAAESEIPPEDLVVSGKRRRVAVDYAALNAEIFGDVECYDGEGEETTDQEFVPGRGPRGGKGAEPGEGPAAGGARGGGAAAKGDGAAAAPSGGGADAAAGEVGGGGDAAEDAAGGEGAQEGARAGDEEMDEAAAGEGGDGVEAPVGAVCA